MLEALYALLRRLNKLNNYVFSCSLNLTKKYYYVEKTT